MQMKHRKNLNWVQHCVSRIGLLFYQGATLVLESGPHKDRGKTLTRVANFINAVAKICTKNVTTQRLQQSPTSPISIRLVLSCGLRTKNLALLLLL